MSILFVLVMFLLCISFSYFFGSQRGRAVGRGPEPVRPPVMAREGGIWAKAALWLDGGFELPQGYCFHPGHTWVLDEGRQNARVGLDAFAVNLLGKIDRIEVTPHDRWVRQGQKIWSVTRDGVTVDMVAPVEGMVTSVNPKVLNDPNRIVEDPYGEGWVLTLQAPQLGSCLNNLLRGSVIRAWMQNSMERVGALCTAGTGVALDGGPPIRGALAHAGPELRNRMIKEFFLL